MIELMMACAPAVAPETIRQIIHVESRGNPLAINVNKGRLERQPKDAADAAVLAKGYIEQGYTVDLGLMQINSTNVARLGYRIEDMFDPCKNIAAGARVLSEFYARAKPSHSDEQAALRAALSAYNTGSFTNGFSNGYVARYGAVPSSVDGPVVLARLPLANMPDPFTAATTVAFHRPAILKKEGTAMTIKTDPVISQSPEDAATPGVQVEYTPEEADMNGAFEETAMSEEDAWAANAEIAAQDTASTAIVINGKQVVR